MRLISNSGQRIQTCALSFLAFILIFTWFDLSVCAAKGSSKLPAKIEGRSEGPERVFESFNAKKFTHPTIIDNEWLPLKPGSQWVFEGSTTEDGETLSHRLEFTVTDMTKVIAGVQTVVAYVVDYAEKEVVEKEIAFYAQDDDGNVWYLGEYPEEYEDGKFLKAPAWLAGLDDAKAGIKMKARPQLGTPSYFQGWGPKVEWTDYGRVEKMGEKTCVPAGCYEDVLVIAESALNEVNGFQLKYHARNVGEVRVNWKGDDAKKEELELVKYAQLDPQALAKVGAEALELERHAYEVSPKVYALTAPLSGGSAHSLPQRPVPQATKPAAPDVRKISEEKAKEIALKAVPGDAMDVSIEKKLGANRYVVEVIAKEDGSETDVIIDMETGKILATEK